MTIQSEAGSQKPEARIKKSGNFFLKNLPLTSYFLLLTYLLTGCSLKTIALKSTTELLGKGLDAFYEEKDIQFAEESMTSHLKLLEVFLKNEPSNEKLNLYASQGFGAYAFLFIEEKNPERAKLFYERGRDYGLKILNGKTKIDFLKETDLNKIDEVLKKLTKRDVPMLFWSAYSWGGLVNLSLDHAELIAQLPKIEKMMVRVNEVSPDYFYGGASIFLGSYYGSRPKMFGGDLEKSKSYFEKALKISNEKFLMADLLYAKYYAIPAQDKEFFKTILGKTISFPLESFPEQRLSNEIAVKRAKKLMETIDEKF